MDFHIAPGVTAKDAAEAHLLDLKIQKEYGCKCITYWHDSNRGSGFCLIEAENQDSVINLHSNSHGNVPFEIIQVDKNIVKAFLGRDKDPETYDKYSDTNLKIIEDPAFRIILVTKTKDERLLKHELGEERATELLAIHNKIIRKQIKKYNGREAELFSDGFIVSFVSVNEALECAVTMRKSLHVATGLLDMRIGIHSGMPVNKSSRIFGKTIDLASFFCSFGKGGQIAISSQVKNLFKNDKIKLNSALNNAVWISPAEERFLEFLLETLEKNWNNSEFNIMDFCSEMAVSKSQLYRKSKYLTGMSPNELVREFRLNKALELLKDDNQNISEVSYETGFNSPSYFTKCFQNRFGIQPLIYHKELA